MRILYIDIDSLRPDHLGCYGYFRNTSPNIDRIARDGVIFDNYYCSDAPCLPSRTALFSGRFGIHTGVAGHGGTAADMRILGSDRKMRGSTSLPTLLRSAGLKTVSISSFAERHSAWHFCDGFSEMHNPGHYGKESADEVTPIMLKWIENNGKEDNWFLHVNFWDVHTPYKAPLEFGNPFENEPIPGWITEEVFAKHFNKVGPHGTREINFFNSNTNPSYPRMPGELNNMNDVRKMFDGYDTGILYADLQIGMALDALEKQGVSFDDLAVIISADHGENMGELGIYGDHMTADAITCRIPMIIKWPGCKAGYADNGFHYNLDLVPTMAELLSAEPFMAWDGMSFAPSLMNGESCDRGTLVVTQGAHSCQRGVRFDKWMYVKTYHDGYHLFPDEMLFNLDEDPHEQHDIAGKYPEICREAVYRLDKWHDDMMMSMSGDVDPLWTMMKEGGAFHTIGNLEEYCKRLEETGRAWAIPELKKRHPREFNK